jgi:hypothetical protein
VEVISNVLKDSEEKWLQQFDYANRIGRIRIARREQELKYIGKSGQEIEKERLWGERRYWKHFIH